MDYNEWKEKYKPVEFSNTLTGHPYLLETYDNDLERVVKANPDCVWTLLASDDSNVAVLVSGFRFVNRLNYIITEVPVNVGEFIEVTDD
jgi:hypothetical protein